MNGVNLFRTDVMLRSSTHDRNRRVRGTDGGILTPYRGGNPCEAGFRQIRTSGNQTSGAEGLHRSDQHYTFRKGIFNPLTSSREPRRTSVALWQIGAYRETAFG